MTFFHLENLRFSRVLRTRDRLVRSGQHFIHSLLAIVGAAGPGAALAQSESAAALVTPLVDAGHLAGAVVLVTGPDAVVAEEVVGMADRKERRAEGEVRQWAFERFSAATER